MRQRSFHIHNTLFLIMCLSYRPLNSKTFRYNFAKKLLKGTVQTVLIQHFNNHLIEGRKEMFHLTTHSTHFIYSYMA